MSGRAFDPDFIEKLAHGARGAGETIHRVFYYDCAPFQGQTKLPISGHLKSARGKSPVTGRTVSPRPVFGGARRPEVPRLCSESRPHSSASRRGTHACGLSRGDRKLRPSRRLAGSTRTEQVRGKRRPIHNAQTCARARQPDQWLQPLRRHALSRTEKGGRSRRAHLLCRGWRDAHISQMPNAPPWRSRRRSPALAIAPTRCLTKPGMRPRGITTSRRSRPCSSRSL